MKDIFDHLARNRARHLDELTDFLRIQSVSTRPEHAGDVRAAAAWVAAALERAGLEAVALAETGGSPIVTARTPHVPGAPTVLVYGHYDVQPAEPLDLWKTPPFEPTVRGGRIYARGAADDKGQVFIHLKVLEAFHAARGAFPCNVKLLIEGEEEVGSPHLLPFLRRNRRALACDVVLVSDTHMLGREIPSITTGLRGLATFDVTVTAARTDLHSGTFGGSIANPLQVLCQMLAACKDPRSGRVKIPGFYDDVRPLTRAERASLRRIPHDDARFARSVGARALFGERGKSTLERIGARPTFEINGLWGGYTGDGFKTVLPAEAHAKISTRLVPDQDPAAIARLVRDHLLALAPDHVRVKVRVHRSHQGPPSRVDPDFPAMRVAARAVEAVFGKPPLYALEGGSIPIVAHFKKVLGRETILLGFGLPDDNLHAPNEKFDLKMLDRGMRTVAHFLDGLGRGEGG